jgi:hypothetical protein
MERSPSEAAGSHSASQGMPRLVWDLITMVTRS